MKKIIIILIGLMSTQVAFACECGPSTFEQEVQSSNSIFHGRVIAVNEYLFKIEIIEVWKGGFATKTFNLLQGQTSCEKRLFELNKEYIFYLRGQSVYNCSRTAEYQFAMDSELLDLKFKDIGDKKSIESDSLTNREITILKLLLKSKNISRDDIGEREVLFATEDKWVGKWTFFSSYKWPDLETKLIKLDPEENQETLILWTGYNWAKSLKKLKKDKT